MATIEAAGVDVPVYVDTGELERRTPGLRVLEGYGLTETSAVTTFNLPDRHKPCSVGLPLPSYRNAGRCSGFQAGGEGPRGSAG